MYIYTIIHLFIHYLLLLSFYFLFHCLYCCIPFRSINYRYHSIVSHLILVICSITMIIVHSICKKIYIYRLNIVRLKIENVFCMKL